MHPHHDDVGDSAALHQAKGFVGIGDRVAVVDRDRGDLPRPGPVVFDRLVAVTASVRVVDGERSLVRRVDAAPAFERPFRLDLRRGLGQLPLRSVLIELHRVAGAVNDEHPARPSRLHNLIHARSHLPHASGRVRAPMLVPHVTDDDGRLLGVPLGRRGDRVIPICHNSSIQSPRPRSHAVLDYAGNHDPLPHVQRQRLRIGRDALTAVRRDENSTQHPAGHRSRQDSHDTLRCSRRQNIGAV